MHCIIITLTTGENSVCECPACETPVYKTSDHECRSSTAPLIAGVIIGIVGFLVGACSCGLIITYVAVKR